MNSSVTTDIASIPVKQLRSSRFNVRKTGGMAVGELADSIASVGLLQNLTVVADPNGETYGVVAGKRRCAALKQLIKQKRLPEDAVVPCRIVQPADATAASLTENVQRVAMHPADQFDAFAKLVAEGKTLEAVAAQFGVTPVVVQRRLKLANVSPRLLADFRADEISLDQLMALASVDDHAAQEAAFYEAAAWQRSPESLRDHLTADKIDARSDRVARFVGAETYLAAGDVIRRDLFADDEQDGFIGDVGLLDQLARERLEPHAEKARAQGWAWVDIAPRAAAAELAGFQRAHGEHRTPTAKEAKKLADIDAKFAPLDVRIQTLEDIEDDEEREATHAEYDQLQDQREKLDRKRSALENKLLHFPPEVMALAGAIVTIDAQGNAVVHAGLLRTEDAQALQRRNKAQRASSPADGVSPAAKPGISEALARNLSAHHTAALQIELARQPKIAVVALVHALTLQLFYDVYHPDTPVRIKPTEQTKLAQFAAGIETAPASIEFDNLCAAWREQLPEDPNDLFAALQSLSADDVLALLALCTARTLDAVTRSEEKPEAADIARALQLDMRPWWSATADTYFAQVSKTRIIEAVRDFAPASTPRLTCMKKTLMVTEAERLAAGTDWLPPLLAAPQ
jgi:ParB family transcriptional regulator, chromosome partitioning protein